MNVSSTAPIIVGVHERLGEVADFRPVVRCQRHDSYGRLPPCRCGYTRSNGPATPAVYCTMEGAPALMAGYLNTREGAPAFRAGYLNLRGVNYSEKYKREGAPAFRAGYLKRR